MLDELYVTLAVVPLSITEFLISLNDDVSIGYIVWMESDRLISSILLILAESTVTCISIGVPFSISEEVYTPGVYIMEEPLASDKDEFLTGALVVLLAGSLPESIYMIAVITNIIIIHMVIISFLSGITNILVELLIR